MRIEFTAVVIGAAAFISGCGKNAAPTATSPGNTPATSLEVVALKEKVAALEAEIKQLRATPAALLAAVEAAGADIPAATAAAVALKSKYPASAESSTADKRIAALVAKAEKDAEQAKRVAALGLKALAVGKRIAGDEATVVVSAAALANSWTFDAYDGRYHYRKPEKGAQFVTARVSVSSKNKDPKLPGFALYASDGASMVKVVNFEYRFTRWDDYGTYLGNSADYGNDFAHASTIPMTIGASLDNDKAKRPLFIVATLTGCHESKYDRFSHPPMSYSARGCDTLKDKLTAADFADGRVAVAHRID